MIPTEIDSQWFHNNPDREFRLRRQPPAEFQAWPVPLEPGMVAWCIIRKSDGAVEQFALPAGDEWDDHDEELAPFFEQLQGHSK
ncbi:MAG: hypothetical protein MIN69_16765 [Methylorubrum extorquens]|jgi:hypothetical protein|uniref:Uncharacterized protein n=1 Tax=Methylorubrum extorquens DSM 13060 TaxID=882800 RepID=H1KJ62_METEX|nr:hypothetical protein [Methylorubrum extorquens]EHP92441.1 hypothetical protein MetexDRAFT_2674 [Methylorubrum extorquens DSM 13060]MCG5249667.1 hypothetical protein [Methylorubrum extorquens]